MTQYQATTSTWYGIVPAMAYILAKHDTSQYILPCGVEIPLKLLELRFFPELVI